MPSPSGYFLEIGYQPQKQILVPPGAPGYHAEQTDNRYCNQEYRPKDKEYGVRVPQVPALRVRVKPTGAKAYTIAERLNGKQVRHTFPGQIDDLSGAIRWAWAIKDGFKRGIDPCAKKPAEVASAPVTVADVLEQYLKRRVRPRLKSARALEVQLKHELEPWLGRPIRDIGPADIHVLLDALIDSTRKGIAANRFISHASPMFSFAVGRATIPGNPFIGIRRPVAEVPRDRVLDDGEIIKILIAAREGLDNAAWEFIWLLMITAARRSEISKMRWSEIDRSTWLWVLPKERSKNGKGHSIALPGLAIEVLCEIIHNGDGYVLGGVNGFTSYDKTKKRLDKLLPGLPHWTYHDLRRSAATGMARLGVQPWIIDRCLNHQSGSRIERTYNCFDHAGEMKDAFARWSKHLETLLYGEPDSNVIELRR